MIALKNVLRQRRRSLLLLSTVAFGICGICLFRAFNDGIMRDYRSKVIHFSTAHGRIILRAEEKKDVDHMDSHWISNANEIGRRLKAAGLVADVFQRQNFPAFLTDSKSSTKPNIVGMGQGIDGPKEDQFFSALNLRAGVKLTDQAKGILLGEGLAKSLDVHVGDHVTVLASTADQRLNGIDLKVVGIFWTGVASVDDSVFRLPLAQSKILLETDRTEALLVALKPSDDQDPQAWNKVRRFIKKNYPELEAQSFEDQDQVYYGNSIRFLSQQFQMILSIILLVVVLGVLNIVFVSTLNRSKEFAVLRANGESRLNVLNTLLLESSLLGCAGSVLGILGAYVLYKTLLRHGIWMPPAPGFSNHYYAMLYVDLRKSLSLLLIGILATLGGTFLGALWVSRLPLQKALRAMEGF